jgi:sulfite exporter TauE/SafE
MDSFLLSGLMVGLFGSLHCIGMCGPIALAVPRFPLTYNIGRVITYSVLGLGMGLAGSVVRLTGLQQGLSIATGVVVILAALYSMNKHRFTGRIHMPDVSGFLSTRMKPLWQGKSRWHILAIGLLNGILPCGFVYVGLAGALTVADPLKSTLYMTLFGLGTIPAMLAMSLAGMKLNLVVRSRIRAAMPWLAIVLGILMVLRGLELGIPMISPVMSGMESCH